MIEVKTKYGRVFLPSDMDYLNEVYDILNNDTFLSMNQFIQHGKTTCLEHSIDISYKSYISAKKTNLDARSAARGGLLHDMFLYDWHNYKKNHGELPHGFTHPLKAYRNAKKLFNLNKIEKDIILKHMWPLTIVPPRYKESYIVLYHDKSSALSEMAEHIRSFKLSLFFKKQDNFFQKFKYKIPL